MKIKKRHGFAKATLTWPSSKPNVTDKYWLCAGTAPSGFFCPAEDGIRGLYVTGVQTCALPISPLHATVLAQSDAGKVSVHLGVMGTCSTAKRSEERRVGKECRSRWSPYH